MGSSGNGVFGWDGRDPTLQCATFKAIAEGDLSAVTKRGMFTLRADQIEYLSGCVQDQLLDTNQDIKNKMREIDHMAQMAARLTRQMRVRKDQKPSGSTKK